MGVGGKGVGQCGFLQTKELKLLCRTQATELIKQSLWGITEMEETITDPAGA